MGLLTSLFRRSLENPTTSLSDPDEWLYETLGGNRSDAGVKVNGRTALGIPALWRAANLIAGSGAKLPLYTLKKSDKGKDRATDHPAYRLLRHKPNPETTAITWKRVMFLHALLFRGGFSYVFRHEAGPRDGSPREIIQLNPQQTHPLRVDGRLVYVTTIKGNAGEPPQTRKLPATDVIHVKGLSFDGLEAYSLIDMAKQSLGLALAQDKYAAIYFKNNGRPDIVLRHPRTLSAPARENLRKSWNDLYTGLDNSHRAAILEEGLEVHDLSWSVKDSQLLEGRQFTLTDVANWTGVPKRKLGGEGGGFASLEQENQAFLDESLEDWLVSFEEECYDKLLTEDEKNSGEWDIEFDRAKLVQANLAAKTSYWRQALGGRPWASRTEARLAFGLQARDNPEDDEILDPANMSVLGGPGGESNQGGGAGLPAEDGRVEEEQQPAAEEKGATGGSPASAAVSAELRSAHRQLIVEAAGRMARRLTTHAIKAAKEPRTFLDWLERGLQEHAGVVSECFAAPLTAWDLVAHGNGRSLAEAVDHFIPSLRAALTARYDTAPPAEFLAAVETECRAFIDFAPAELADFVQGETP